MTDLMKQYEKLEQEKLELQRKIMLIDHEQYFIALKLEIEKENKS